MVVAAVNQGYVHRQAGEAAGCVNAGKAAADDDNAKTAGKRQLKRSEQFAQIVNLSLRRCRRGAIGGRSMGVYGFQGPKIGTSGTRIVPLYGCCSIAMLRLAELPVTARPRRLVATPGSDAGVKLTEPSIADEAVAA